MVSDYADNKKDYINIYIDQKNEPNYSCISERVSDNIPPYLYISTNEVKFYH